MSIRKMLPSRPVEDYDNYSTDTGLTETKFQQNARRNPGWKGDALCEGISGCAPISTQYENVENADEVNAPRSVQRHRDFNNGLPHDCVVPGTNPDADVAGDSDGDMKKNWR